MKKMIAIILAAVMLLGLAACGSLNKSEVAILWSGDGIVKVPNSLINSMERAMYIESISYAHYGAKGDASTQIGQAETAVVNGCGALVVELVDSAFAQSFVDLAMGKNIPVVFFNCQVDDAVLESYNKCAVVSTDAESVDQVQSKMIADHLVENYDKLDRNQDGKISYAPIGEVDVAPINTALENAEKPALEAVADETSSLDEILADHSDEAGNMVELVITASDEEALEALKALQALGFNDTRLNTHCIPLFTVGADADATAFTDTSDLSEEELAVFIYNSLNLVDAGKLAGVTLEDYDSIAIATASALAGLLKGAADVEAKVAIPFTTYTG